jgi:exodeoxyribonuclease VIII
MAATICPPTALPDWSNTQYHADISRVSKSGLDKIAKSPAHYFHAYLSPDRPTREETPAMRLGSAIHCAILEPAAFPDRYGYLDDALIVAEIGGGNPRATAKYKSWKAAVEMENVDKVVLTNAEYQTCVKMRAAVWAHPTAAKLLTAPGRVEQTFLFTEPASGAACKVRPDKVAEMDGDVLIVDLKSTEDASASEFGRSAVNFGYDKQAAFYSDGFQHATGITPAAVVFIAVEKSAPYNVAVYFADEEVMQLGREKYLANCKTYAECVKSGVWPGYGNEVNNLKLPAYAFTK